MTVNRLYSNKHKVMSIIEQAFKNNPGVTTVINPKLPNALTALARYAYETAYLRKGIYLTPDGEATALCYRYNAKKEGFKDYFNQVKLIHHCIGWQRLFTVLKRDAYIKKQRPRDGSFLYFWFLGATDKGKQSGSAWALKREIFGQSNSEGLPIYLETSVEKNKRVYERMGFETYHIWPQATGGNLFFMRRMPKD